MKKKNRNKDNEHIAILMSIFEIIPCYYLFFKQTFSKYWNFCNVETYIMTTKTNGVAKI